MRVTHLTNHTENQSFWINTILCIFPPAHQNLTQTRRNSGYCSKMKTPHTTVINTFRKKRYKNLSMETEQLYMNKCTLNDHNLHFYEHIQTLYCTKPFRLQLQFISIKKTPSFSSRPQWWQQHFRDRGLHSHRCRLERLLGPSLWAQLGTHTCICHACCSRSCSAVNICVKITQNKVNNYNNIKSDAY